MKENEKVEAELSDRESYINSLICEREALREALSKLLTANKGMLESSGVPMSRWNDFTAAMATAEEALRLNGGSKR